MFIQVSSSLTNSYFGWQLLRSFPWDEFDNKKDREMESVSWCPNGTDPALLLPLRMTDTTRPSENL
uniref:Ovule protein n=1 Tax=Heterorhabditis bacteriophora TaxID=37862 RepID=A0A1I7XHV1_HETBA